MFCFFTTKVKINIKSIKLSLIMCRWQNQCTNKGKQRSDIVLELLGQPIPNNVSLDETMSPILQLHTHRPTQTKGSANCTGQIFWSFSSPCSVTPGSLKEGKLIDTVATSPTYPLWNQQLIVFYLFTWLSKHAEKFIDHCCEEYKQWRRQNMDLLTQFLQAGNFKILGQDGLFTSSCFLSYSVIFVLVSVIYLIWMQIWNRSHSLLI